MQRAQFYHASRRRRGNVAGRNARANPNLDGSKDSCGFS